jgi:hypothetical protein
LSWKNSGGIFLEISGKIPPLICELTTLLAVNKQLLIEIIHKQF